jgi:1,4-alpha-glucan branching enzyme
MKARLNFVLHAHLPYVRHPEHPVFLEENWFFEGLLETYLPLAVLFDRLTDERVPWAVTMTLSPTLVSMMTDPLLKDRFTKRLELLCELAERECERNWNNEWADVAYFYRDRFHHLLRYWNEEIGRDLCGRFSRHMDSGRLEGITCAATHGFLPLLSVVPQTVEAQVKIGVRTFERVFGRAPGGIWIPECAYFDGLDAVLARHGIGFFFLESHGLLYADPSPPAGVYAPLRTPAGPLAFARDPDSSKLIWSQEEGYPGDGYYRDFYRDIGYDLPYDYVRPYLHTDGPRGMTGFKYHRITGRTDDKARYEPGRAMEKAFSHARDFIRRKEEQAGELKKDPDWIPIVTCPFDAELFGHWWFEGIEFLGGLFREAARSRTVSFATPPMILKGAHWYSEGIPEPSSWGVDGYYEVWLNGSNDWIWPFLHDAARDMVRLAERESGDDPIRKEILDQMGRELLLAQSSDWPFLMKTGTATDYAVRRVKDHLYHFRILREMLFKGPIKPEILTTLQNRTPIFPDLDFRDFRT